VFPVREAWNKPVNAMITPAIAVMIPTQSGPPLAVVKPNTIATAMTPTPAAASESPTFLSRLTVIENLLLQVPTVTLTDG
jgi:hypothetical protein